jgi:hypothetical protein
MNRLLLNLLALPTLVGSSFCWLTAMPAQSIEKTSVEQNIAVPDRNATEAQVCVMSRHSRFNLVCEKVSILKNAPKVKPVDYATDHLTSPAEFNFSEEESNASIALFGCDCPLCINSLRTLRTMPQGVS